MACKVFELAARASNRVKRPARPLGQQQKRRVMNEVSGRRDSEAEARAPGIVVLRSEQSSRRDAIRQSERTRLRVC